MLSASRGRLRSGDRKLQTEKAAVPDTVARGPVPRDLSRAPEHGEGQAHALREGEVFLL